jgi:hypothetical protein
MEKGAGNTIIGAAIGAVVGLILARKLGGADVRHALRGISLTSIAIGAVGGGLSAMLFGQKKTNVAMLVVLVTVVALVMVALGFLVGPDTLRTAAE